MPDPIKIVQPPESIGHSGTPPEHLAVQAPPDIVSFAERIHQAFLESLQSKLTVAMGGDARASFVRTEQSFLARYRTNMDPGVHTVVLSLQPLEGCALLRFPSELLYGVLDVLLASPPEAVGPRGQTVTEIELHVLRDFFQIFSEALKESWCSEPPVALTPTPESTEETLLHYGDLNGLALKSTLEVAGAVGDFTVVVPAFFARLSAKAAGTSTRPTLSRITEALGFARVDMEAVLSNLTLRIGDLLELEPGQILLAQETADSTFECLVNQHHQFRGELVPAGERYGFQLAHAGAADKVADSPADR
jgi:flagellar motor switch protein FliM